MHDPKWCLFFDFHTMPACPDVGRAFDVDKLTDRIKACGVDYIVFPARCNLGMAYYDTAVGIRHPSLRYDLFGRLAEACRSKGIALSAYINVGLSHEEGLLHRDWTVVTPEGYALKPPHLSHWTRNMCYNSPYADHLLEMMREVVTGYPVAGIFCDCMGPHECVGVECVREMKTRDLDWNDPDARRNFADDSLLRMAERISQTVKALNPELLLYMNGVPYEDQAGRGTYLELEHLPCWGYDTLPLVARFIRNFDKPAINMTGRFHESWGDFGGIRTEASLEYDCVQGLANGLRTTVGDHFHPRGDIIEPVFDLVGRTYAKLQRLNPWLDGARPVTDMALVVPDGTFNGSHPLHHPRAIAAAKGAARMLCELKAQFDVRSSAMGIGGHSLLILPDHVAIHAGNEAAIRRHLDAGGALVSSAWSGLNEGRDAFAFPDDWGLRFRGGSPHDPAYIAVGEELAAGIPAMPITLYERGTTVDLLAGTETLADIVAPYYNNRWDGEHAFLYTPPDKPSGETALTRHGRVIHFTHPLFGTYFKHAQIPMRQLLANVLAALLPRPVLRTEGLPSFARTTVTEQGNRRMVYLMAYVPERRGEQLDIVEESIELRDVTVALRGDGVEPRKVYLAPDLTELPFDMSDGYIRTRVPVIRGYAVVVFEGPVKRG